MDADHFSDWLDNARIFRLLPDNRKDILYSDNCCAHKITERATVALQKSRTKLCFFPACVTDLVQPADAFVFKRLKSG